MEHTSATNNDSIIYDSLDRNKEAIFFKFPLQNLRTIRCIILAENHEELLRKLVGETIIP